MLLRGWGCVEDVEACLEGGVLLELARVKLREGIVGRVASWLWEWKRTGSVGLRHGMTI